MAEGKDAGDTEVKTGAAQSGAATAMPGTVMPGTSEADAVPSAGWSGSAESAVPPGTTSRVATAGRRPRSRSQSAMDEAAAGVKEAARSARDAMDEAIGDDELSDLGERTRNVAGRFVEDVRDAATRLLEDQKTRAAESVHGLADALHRTAEALSEENASVAQLTDRVAERIEAAGARFRERSWSDILADAEDFAHRRPAMFMIGAVALGFALGRVMAASGRGGEVGED